jgi:HSP20 family protein
MQQRIKTMAEQKSKPEGAKSKGNGAGGSRGQLGRPQSRLPSSMYWGPLGRLRTEFDRLFDEFFQGWPSLGEAGRGVAAGVEVQDRDDAVVIQADAPGFEPGDFDIEMRGENLVLRATQSEEKTEEEGGRQWKRREMFHSIPLPAEIDADKIDAQYRNGVLTIIAAKREPTKSRKIEVKA